MTKKKNGKRAPMTAGEFMKNLEADPEFVARRKRKNAELEEKRKRIALAEAPILRDLKSVGLDSESVWDLLQIDAKDLPRDESFAIDVVLRHASRDYPSVSREGLFRLLALFASRGFFSSSVWDDLAQQLREERDERVKTSIALALDKGAGASRVDSLIDLLEDRELGPVRIMFLDTVYERGGPRGREVLAGLADDEDLSEELPRVLNKL